MSYSPVEESAHQLAGAHHLAAPQLTDAVAAEVGVELNAVIRAELGDLSGRAIQATALDRIDASPVQVDAADDLLRTDPLSDELLTAPIDPAAACVAAAHWLAAAAVIAAAAAGNTAAGVFAEADDIQAVSVPVRPWSSRASRTMATRRARWSWTCSGSQSPPPTGSSPTYPASWPSRPGSRNSSSGCPPTSLRRRWPPSPPARHG